MTLIRYHNGSGSTGKPKAVLVLHSGTVARVLSYQDGEQHAAVPIRSHSRF